MTYLELIAFIYFDDGRPNEPIMYHEDTFTEEVLEAMKEQMSAIEYTFEELKSADALHSSIKEINVVIYERDEDDDADVLEEVTISFN